MNSLKILYIEDEEWQRKTLSEQLQRKGYRVTTAASGRTGLGFIQKRKFDAVLCDLNMPEIDGLEVLEKTKKIRPNLPIIILSSRGSIPQAVKAIKKGAYDFILEPPEIEEIDNTIQKAVEASRLHTHLQSSQDELQKLLENVPDVIYSLNPSGEFISVSPGVKDQLGYLPSELVGTSVFRLIHPDDRKRVREGFMRGQRSGRAEVRTAEFRMASKSGKIKHYEVRGRTYVENGKIIRNDGIARDITEKKRIEEELAEKSQALESAVLEMSQSRDELEAILDTYPDAIIMINNEGRIRAANRGINLFFGIRIEKLINQPFEHFLDSIKPCFEDFSRFLQISEEMCLPPSDDFKADYDPQDVYSRAVKQVHPKERLIIPINIPTTDREGKERGRTLIYSDITVIKRSYDQLQIIVKASPIPLLVSRLRDGKVIFINDHFAELLGYQKADLLNKTTPNFYYQAEDRRKVVAELEKNSRIRSCEIRVARPDGSFTWVILSSEVTRIGEDDVAITGFYDIQERKQAEEALEQERNFISTLLDTVSALVVVMDRKARITVFNRACEKATGYRLKEIKGRPIWDIFILPEERDKVRARFKQLQAGQFPNQGENYWKTKTGEPRLIFWTNTVLLDPEGRAEHIIGTGTDITEHRKIEEALKKSEHSYRELVESANSIILRWDYLGNITFINSYGQDFFGYSSKQIIGKNVMDTIVPKQDSYGVNLTELIKDIRTHPQNYTFNVNENIKRSGERVWINWTNRPILDENGKLKEILSIGIDVTERLKVERELRETQTQLVQSEKMASLGTLVAGIAHEINTPIGAVNSMHDTLFRTLRKIKDLIHSHDSDCFERIPQLIPAFKIVDDSYQVIRSGTDRVMNLVTRLKSFARLDEAELKKVDIHAGLDDTLVLIHHELKHHVTIKKNYGQVPPISCFPGQLNQVFLNLLINSKQAIRDKGTVTLTTNTKNDRVFIKIQDDGIGIPKENLHKIFDPGFTTKKQGIGTGLGLSICHRIIQSHHGEIKVESSPGKGTVFTIILPMDLEKRLESENHQG